MVEYIQVLEADLEAVTLCVAGNADAHAETCWGGHWSGALKLLVGMPFLPETSLLSCNLYPNVTLPYWEARSWDPLTLSSALVEPGEWRLTSPSFMLESNHNTVTKKEGWLCCYVFFKLSTKHTFPFFSLTITTSCQWPKKDKETRDFCLLKKLQRSRYLRELPRFSDETPTKSSYRLPDWLATIWHGLRDVFIVVVQLLRVTLSNL